MFAENRTTGVVVSVFLNKIPQQAEMQECRRYLQGKAEDKLFKKKDIKVSESGLMVLLEYLVPEVEGHKIRQKAFSPACRRMISTLMSTSRKHCFNRGSKNCLPQSWTRFDSKRILLRPLLAELASFRWAGRKR